MSGTEYGAGYEAGLEEGAVRGQEAMSRELAERGAEDQQVVTQLDNRITDLERQLAEAKERVRELEWHPPWEHIKLRLAPMFAEFLDIQKVADDAETFEVCDSATAKANSLLGIILNMAIDAANRRLSDDTETITQLRSKNAAMAEALRVIAPCYICLKCVKIARDALPSEGDDEN